MRETDCYGGRTKMLSEPNHTNTGLRKEKYKRFWTMMHHRNVWEDERYKSKKREALKRDPRC